ncbi:flagellar motor protein MotA [Vibrio sp. SM6]|uniref:Flagellar motor protein MotA n=1 Tax=Vibrio agarilyticus TaxID=2726741 RepID=A0A7X8TPY5_9VIBR|nr:MotA/TolQ/ExbB proton channel family protein [Vibrio agarilyticus]NLS12073.1 flagellar motor protein MotA [Vibrio agarilyticus]
MTAMPSLVVAESISALPTKAQQASSTQSALNKQREAAFKQTEQERKQLHAALNAERAKLQKEADDLAAQFTRNEATLAKREEQLRLETGSLGELFGVVRQNAKSIQTELSESVVGINNAQSQHSLNEIVAAKTLPTLAQLNAMWRAMQTHIESSRVIEPVMVNVVDGTGERNTQQVQRLGAIGLLNDEGYLDWHSGKAQAMLYAKQPQGITTAAIADSVATGALVTAQVDPSRGVLLSQLALTPTLKDRLAAGGMVGNVIIGLLLVGLMIGLVRGLLLVSARAKIAAQLKQPEQPGNNPLGRILAVYQKDKQKGQHRTVEALELRLLEAVVDEQNGLEKGLSMLKLLAALAPMLGLLGTVTGMIETFQVITQFGNGDPKVMAGGISMALVTTVLGLIAAMPLLLVHNILSSQAESIRNILEKQGIGMVAELAENDAATPHLVESAA